LRIEDAFDAICGEIFVGINRKNAMPPWEKTIKRTSKDEGMIRERGKKIVGLKL
jgi:hypothetical protein